MTAAPPAPRTSWLLLAGLILLYLLLRLPNLRALPVFCDEAAYVRWAQLIWEDPLRNYWVSMADWKLPLHYWLLALTVPWFTDPVVGARVLSVLCGAALIPVLFFLGRELACLATPRPASPLESPKNASWFGAVASLFMIASPLMAEYQRLGIAESLLMLESVLLLWLSLRLARRVTENAPRSRVYGEALALGAAWGMTLLTKQNFSYLLWCLPPIALVTWSVAGARWQIVRAWLAPFTLATATGLALFLPAVWSGIGPNTWNEWSLKLFYKAGFFRVPGQSRAEVLGMNLSSLLSPRIARSPAWWPHDASAPLEDGMLYVYLTPPVFLLLGVGLVWLLRRRLWMPLVLFGAWAAILLGAVLANHNWIKTRYALLGILPVLLLAAWIGAAWLGRLLDRPAPPTASRRTLAALAAVLILAWPLAATVALVRDPAAPIRTKRDRGEYLADASAGAAIEQAVAWLRHEADRAPITIITHPGFGTENDYVWVALRGHPNILLLATEKLPLLPAPDGTLEFCTEQWFRDRTALLRLEPGRPVYTLRNGNPNPPAWRNIPFAANPPLEHIAPAPQGALVQVFSNPPILPGATPEWGMAILRLNASSGIAGAAPPR